MARVTFVFTDEANGLIDFRADFHRSEGERDVDSPAHRLARTVVQFLEREAVQKVETPPTLAEITGA